jgi:hypothetical protein
MSIVHNTPQLAQTMVDTIESDPTDRLTFNTFVPSIFSGVKSATTTVTGQSEAIAEGTIKIQVTNKDATNGCYIGFGNSASAAEAACSSGTAGINRFLVLADSQMLQLVNNYSHYAWLGIGGTVSLRISQGV